MTTAPPRTHAAGHDLDFSTYQQRYVALDLMYLGHEYDGFARQENTDETIEVRRRWRQRGAIRTDNPLQNAGFGCFVCGSWVFCASQSHALPLFVFPHSPPARPQRYLLAALKHTRLVPPDANWEDLHYSRGGRTDKGVSGEPAGREGLAAVGGGRLRRREEHF